MTAPPADLGDGGDHAVQEVAVVRDDDHRAVVGGEEVLEPGERLEVEVVGGLVEQQEIRTQQEEPGQRRPHAPAARELAERPVDRGGGEAEPAQDDLGLGLEPVAAEGLEAVLDLAVAVGQLRPASAAAMRAASARAPPRAARPRRSRTAPPPARCRPRCADFLGQIADGDAGVTVHSPGVRLLDTREDPAQRGLARAVGPAEADALAPADAPGDLAEQRPGRRSPWRRRRARSRVRSFTVPMVWTRSGAIV